MNLTLYVPRDLESPLKARAEAAGLTPALFVQTVLRDALAADPASFSRSFAALAGSWEDERSADEIIRDIKDHRTNSRRSPWR